MTKEALLVSVFKDVSERLNITKSMKNKNVECRAGFALAARTHGGFPFSLIGSIIEKDHSSVIYLCNNANEGIYNTDTYREAYRTTEILVKHRLNKEKSIEESVKFKKTIEEELESIQSKLKQVDELCSMLTQTTMNVHEELERIVRYSKRLKMILNTNV